MTIKCHTCKFFHENDIADCHAVFPENCDQLKDEYLSHYGLACPCFQDKLLLCEE